MLKFRTFIGCWVALRILVGCDDPRVATSPRSRATVIAAWQSRSPESFRKDVAEELIRDGHLIGLLQTEIGEMLVEPNRRRMSESYGDMKYIVGKNGIDDWWLCLHLRDAKVIKAELRSD